MSKVRVALLGCGGFSRQHVRNYKTIEDVEIVALCDVDRQRVETYRDEQFADLEQKPEVFTDAAAMYAAAKPDAVSICTPHTLHFEHCCQALEAGCHVLVEKPMVTSLAHAYELEKKVAANGQLLCIGYNTPCSVEMDFVRNKVRSGEFGALKVVNAYISQPWYQLTTGTWRQQPELSGGGMIYDSGAHVTCSLVWTVESDIEEVHAWVDNLDTPVDINGTINIRFANGVLASVAVSGESPGGSFGSWMFEQGLIETNPWFSGFLRVWTKSGEIRYPQVGDVASATPMHNFIGAIRGLVEPRTSPRVGVIQSQLMDAIYESARSGKPVKPSDLV